MKKGTRLLVVQGSRGVLPGECTPNLHPGTHIFLWLQLHLSSLSHPYFSPHPLRWK